LNMAKSTKPLVFIDTNIFLDFYRTEVEAGLSLLKHVESVLDSLILTDQVEMEFLKNRQWEIVAALKALKPPETPQVVPAYLAESKAATGIEKGQKQIKQQITRLRNRLAKVLDKPALHDPVFRTVRLVFAHSSPLNLKSADSKQTELLDRAVRRFQRGMPPRKKGDTSIGDAINWEWIIESVKATGRDVIVVSRDGDYGIMFNDKSYLNDWLTQEFRKRVPAHCRIEYTRSLTKALRRLAVKVSPPEEFEEKRIIAKHTGSLGFSSLDALWQELLARSGRASPFVRTYLSVARPVSLSEELLTIGFPFEFEDYIGLVDNSKNHAMLCGLLKEFGCGSPRIRFISLPEIGASTANKAQGIEEHSDSDSDLPF